MQKMQKIAICLIHKNQFRQAEISLLKFLGVENEVKVVRHDWQLTHFILKLRMQFLRLANESHPRRIFHMITLALAAKGFYLRLG